MTAVVDFYLDFMSPYAYLAHVRLPALVHRYGFELAYHPIDLPAAKLAAGNTAPPNVKIPIKLRYLLTDMQRWARRYEVPFQFPKSLNSGAMNTGLFYAIDRRQAERYTDVAWMQCWGKGGDMGDPVLLRQVADEMSWNADEFLGFIASPAAKARFEKSNVEAHARGVFGAPTMMIGEEMWWGNDRLEFLESHLVSITT